MVHSISADHSAGVSQIGCEVKAKSPLARGGCGWDRRAFDRARAWSALSGETVLYALRDLSAAPLPPTDQPDDADHWHVASVFKLALSPHRLSDENYHYWLAADFRAGGRVSRATHGNLRAERPVPAAG